MGGFHFDESKAKQSKAKQSKAKQSKAKQSKAKQSEAMTRTMPGNGTLRSSYKEYL
jgi:hypothetical protein